jgi:hypothetical protein
VTLFSYVVRWDHGFAPNPFYKVCTLATCKPDIRLRAKEGDWVLGTGGSERGFGGRAVFLMRVEEVTSFDVYWSDVRFQNKRPVMNGSLKQRFGDNIYHRKKSGVWVQADSRHSKIDGENDLNLKNDTGKTDRVLIGADYIYWGDQAPKMPSILSRFVLRRPGWENKYSQAEIDQLLAWVQGLGSKKGELGRPIEWRYERWWR